MGGRRCLSYTGIWAATCDPRTSQAVGNADLNWVGGADNVDAAQQILGQGGIPNVALVSGGKVSHIRLEHVWVEAWVDYLPSRSAKHVQGDTWVPLDGSYKQYQYQAGMDLQGQVPVDAQALLTQAQQGATVNDTEGWVSATGI